MWGYGILGKGPNVDSSEFPTLIPPSLFGGNEFNAQSKVKDIQAGLHYFSAINSELFLFIYLFIFFWTEDTLTLTDCERKCKIFL